MHIRNFVIIAHIDHGKSTLADRLLELTHTIEDRKMRAQFLDTMDLERERGITIKMQPVRMRTEIGREEFIFNLIDTPGHVDFTYEVSRALAAVEGAILLVDATQGIQAQTIANLHLAQKEGLTIIPAVNKVDIPSADRALAVSELATLLAVPQEEILMVSGKTGEGVQELLRRVVEKTPPPEAPPDDKLRALIFDSQFDAYKGVIAYVRIVSGAIKKGEKIHMLRTKKSSEVLEVGCFAPERKETAELAAGEIGYIATGLKEAGIRVGDTIIFERDREAGILPLQGYDEPKPVVFASVFPLDADDFPTLKDALDKLKLNDAALSYEVEASEALGRGFRVGFLGMLHLEIISERIQREFDLEIIVSTPSVSYQVILRSGNKEMVYSAADIPDEAVLSSIAEPWVRLEVIAPADYLGRILKLFESTRGRFVETNYLSAVRLLVVYRMPLKEVIIDFYDQLKSATSGYASMGYEFLGYEAGELERLDILIAGKRERAFSVVVHKSEAFTEGKRVVAKLKQLLPSQVFAVPLQAAIGGKIIARETLSAMSKNVTGYLYGGDRTRKMKLWKKQKKGKKRLAEEGMGKVEIPPDVFLKMLRRS
ncbi:MAG: elongation factor 4 [Candidatus Sungbacteria bacterium RIFCSPHIGHO2_02_FULL_49_12]|uniref:Elongation factor 4 n=1 Tax=Candidatus Sungbacteria bacterium RIFCSPHIGHO2_02_FULL_49_12 TaxID=1802271 RepID=A0A1G2KLH9_9BACT|nr:MAG: elongation factor 4 [Candidatus Sungbacteria bacterium RIFCSPHIGHO2_02_FULL_49_12]